MRRHITQPPDAIKVAGGTPQIAPAQQAASDLLQRAQALAHEATADSADDWSDASPQKLREVLQNLRVHQIELEMQNDELRRTQAALDTAQARYFDFYDLAPVGYLTVGKNGVILQANLTTATLLGLPRDRLIGKVFPAFLLPAEADNYYLLCQRVFASKSVQSNEFCIQQSGGHVTWANVQAIEATGTDGLVVIRMVISDITERKHAEAALQASTQLRHAILDSVPLQIAVLDDTGTIVAVNQRWREFAQDNGIPTGETARNTSIGTNYLTVCQAASGNESHDAMQAHAGILNVIHGAEPNFYLEYACHSPTRQRWFALAVTPLRVGNHAVVVTHTDITQRRLLELAASDASEKKFRLVADNTSDGIVVFGADRHITYVSPAYVKQLGYEDESELLKLSPEMVFALVHPEDREVMLASIVHAINDKHSDDMYTYRSRHRLGQYVWREANAKYQYDGLGNFAGACVVVRDITQRRRAQEAMRIAAAAFETQDAILITDANSVIVRANQAFTRTTGYTAEEVMGLTPHFLRSGRHDQDFYRQAWDTVGRTGGWQGEVWDRHQDGSVWPKLLTITAVIGVDGVVSHYVGSYFDLSERKRVEDDMQNMNRELSQSRQQLRRLVALNETTLEHEKRHIAREIHDELGQVLTALRMDLSLAAIRHARRVPQLLDDLNGMKAQVDRAIHGVRHVATSLRPVALDMGLVPAIEWLCRDFGPHGGVECQLKAPDDTITLDASRSVVVFRIVQESLTNIHKYAQASHVIVALACCGNELSVEVRDNGIGFDMAAVAQRGTLGLLGMRERVLALAGCVEVDSQPGQGTVIHVVIPLTPEASTRAASCSGC